MAAVPLTRNVTPATVLSSLGNAVIVTCAPGSTLEGPDSVTTGGTVSAGVEITAPAVADDDPPLPSLTWTVTVKLPADVYA